MAGGMIDVKTDVLIFGHTPSNDDERTGLHFVAAGAVMGDKAE